MGSGTTATERPRERLFQYGRAGLSDGDLLALVLGTGLPGVSAEGLAQRLLERFGGVQGVACATPAQLRSVRGIGQARSARVAACLELGLRVARGDLVIRQRIASPDDVWRLVGRELAFEQRETFKVILLGGRNDVLAVRTGAEGTGDACLVQARDVFREALVEGACGVVLVHNHPSGDPTPSDEDRQLTRRAAEGGRFIGIEVVDHVVVAASGFHSLRDDGGLA